MKQLYALLLILVAITTMPGCGIGYNSLLFVTKSNVGLDFDAKPPTAEIAISRVEGVVEPVFENGKTLPVMASFRPEGKGIFSGNVGQTFATGDAAVVLAMLYGKPTYSFDVKTGVWEKDIEKRFDSALKLSQPPTLPGELTFLDRDVRPLFFGTSTSLGVRISWSGMAAAYPDSLHVGFRRKELALAPIAYSATDKTVRAPSVLATIDVGGSASTPKDSRLEWLQYFATGKAATALALQREVRGAMLARLDPNQKIQEQRFISGLLDDAAPLTMNLLYGVYRFLAVHRAEDQDVDQLVDELDRVGDALSVPESLVFYNWGGEDLENIVAQPALKSIVLEDSGFSRVKNLQTFLDLSIGALSAAGDDALITVGDKNVPAKQIVREQRAYRTALLKQLSNSPAIIKAIDHFNKLLISTKPEGDS